MSPAQRCDTAPYRVAASSGRLVLALALLVAAAMRPEALTGPEMDRVLEDYRRLRFAIQ